MRNFPKPTDSVGGIQKYWFVPVNNVAALGDIILNELQSITFETDKDWLTGYGVYDSKTFTEDKKENKTGIRFLRSLKIFYPGFDLAAVQQMQEMQLTQFIVAYKDFNGLYKVAGTLDNPLNFKYKLETGKTGANSQGYDMEFFADSRIRISDLDPTIFDTITFTVTGNTDIDFITTEPGFVYCRTNDGRSFDVYCNLNGTLSVDDFASGGTIEIYNSFDIIYQLDAGAQFTLTKVENLHLAVNLYYLGLNNNNISEVDISQLLNLNNVALSQNPISSLIFPATSTFEIITMSGTNVSSLDFSPVPELRFMTMVLNPFTTLDFSVLNLDGPTNYFDIRDNNFNQANVDLIIADILARIIITGLNGTLKIETNSAPSAQGLADINTLVVTYGWTITHD